jgi:ATP-dependent Clp protease adaptor protein ClpS
MAGRNTGRNPQTGGEVLEKPRTRTKKPQLYNVILHNDDYTTMDFVVQILESVFHLPTPDAVRIMLEVHQLGRGLCGAYTYEIAETKVATVHEMAKDNGFPLRASMEEA